MASIFFSILIEFWYQFTQNAIGTNYIYDFKKIFNFEVINTFLFPIPFKFCLAAKLICQENLSSWKKLTEDSQWEG